MDGDIEWDVKDCMQSRQDCIIVVKEGKKRRIARKITQRVQRCTEFVELRREAFWSGNTSIIGDACGYSKSYKVRRFGAWQEVW